VGAPLPAQKAPGWTNTPARTMFHPAVLIRPDRQTFSAGETVSLSVALDSFLPPVSSGKLELWLKADAGVEADIHGRVSHWRDQSENRNDAAQPCASLEPLLVFPPAFGGRPAIRFDGMTVRSESSFGARFSTGPYLKGDGRVAIPRAMTSFCVHLLAAPSAQEYALWIVGEPITVGEVRGDLITDDQMRFSFWGQNYDPPFPVPAGNCWIRTDRLADSLHSVEMSETGMGGTVNFRFSTSGAGMIHAGYFIGGCDPDETFGRNFNGDLSELIIYQGALDDGDMQAVTDYLRDKYLAAARLEGAALQWRCNGTNIPGATNATFVLTNARPEMSGAYSIMVRNAAGVVASSNAVIAVKAR
jgi:hypothetical protein